MFHRTTYGQMCAENLRSELVALKADIVANRGKDNPELRKRAAAMAERLEGKKERHGFPAFLVIGGVVYDSIADFVDDKPSKTLNRVAGSETKAVTRKQDGESWALEFAQAIKRKDVKDRNAVRVALENFLPRF